MPRIAKVIVDLSLDREFDYLVPPGLTDDVRVGSRVRVPFGRRWSRGYVTGFADRSRIVGLKEIEAVVGEKPLLGDDMISLARWMADYYRSSFELSVRTVLPGAVRARGSGFKRRKFVTPMEGAAPRDLPTKQAAVLALLQARGGLSLRAILHELSVSQAPVRSLEKKGLVRIGDEAVRRDPNANRTLLPTTPLELTGEQAEALAQIKRCVEACAGRTPTRPVLPDGRRGPPAPGRESEAHGVSEGAVEKSGPDVVLLYGVTGSGKTEVYLQAIDHVRRRGGGAIVLVPEISLTPQTVERFRGRFGDSIAVLHSHLSDGERHDEWHRINDGSADIVIGARSAVFAPVHKLGLIVVDEEHEHSYKQEESPRYNARDVAVMRGHMVGCPVVLGSATPSLESWVNAREGKYRLSRLAKRVDDRQMPSMRVVDMRLESGSKGRVSVLSPALVQAMQARLDRAEQVILFLNRRGFATSLVCLRCGHVADCPDCSVSYTYHRSDEALRCHICGGAKRVPPKCPECGDPAFRFSGIGTQRVEKIVEKCCPGATVRRMDADVTRRKSSYDEILGDFRTGKIDILVGTQMIAKGLHFPNVTLVGIIYADLGLHMPDFRAGERSFQLLAQVAGRAGRGEVPGDVVIQTYTPFHAAIQAARRLDYEGFSDQELEFRRELSYPPFGRLVCTTFKGKAREKVEFCADSFARRLKKDLENVALVADACPAPLSKAKGKYRYQVICRGPSARKMAHACDAAREAMKLPREIACSIDVDALSLL